MTPEAFCYWLQGFFELSDAETLSPTQIQAIKNHLGLVFEHVIDPSYTNHLDEEDAHKVQSKLNHMHGNNNGPIKYRC